MAIFETAKTIATVLLGLIQTDIGLFDEQG